VADRKSFPLRIDSAILEAVQRWANDDLRSLNAQIEYLLRESLRRAGRGSRSSGGDPAEASGSVQGETPNEPDPSADT
jgi:hypothetical protein